jgi:hypothetical protein
MRSRALEEFRVELARLRSGSVRVADARVEPQVDSEGTEYLQVTLVLEDPPQQQAIWSLEDTFELRQHVRSMAEDRQLPWQVRITLTSQGGGDDVDDSEDDAAGGDERILGLHAQSGPMSYCGSPGS